MSCLVVSLSSSSLAHHHHTGLRRFVPSVQTLLSLCVAVSAGEREDENSHAVKLRLALQCLFRRSADTNIWKCDYKLVVYYTYSYYIPTPNVVLLLLLSSSFVRTQG